MNFEQLKLSNQLCFPVYAASRLITRAYQPYLEELGITYPQYLVLMVLWELDSCSVNEINRRLILNTNTVTPLLKRMEHQGLISRHRSEDDERRVIVQLTSKGEQMKLDAAYIPCELATQLVSDSLPVHELIELRNRLNALIGALLDKQLNE